MEDSSQKGIPVEILIRVKSEPYQRQDLRIFENKISLLDGSDRPIDEFLTNGNIYEMVDAFRINFDSIFKKYVNSIMQGINFTIFTFGAKKSGKTFALEGNNNESGIYSLLVENMFNILESKRNSILEDIHSGISPELENWAFSYSVRMKWVEIKDEYITDLLQKYNHLKQPVQLIYSENEGYTITGAAAVNVTNSITFADIFTEACKFKTNFEYNTINKTTSLMTLEFTQILENRQTRQTKLISSKINIFDLSSADILAEHHRNLANSNEYKHLYSIQNMVNELGKLQTSVLPKVFETSVVTKLLKENIGGNCVCLGIVCLQNNDFAISSIVFKFMKMASQILCYPVINNTHLFAILKKFRTDVNYYQRQKDHHPYDLKPPIIQKQSTPQVFPQVSDGGNPQLMNEFKKKLTALEQEKIRLTEELNFSEEERIALTKSLAGLKIKYEQLRELIDGEKFDVSDKLAHIEDDIQESNKIMQSVNDLHDRLRNLTEERNKLEEQFNYIKSNNENLASEMDKMVAENNNYKLNSENEIFNLKELLTAKTNESEYLRMDVEKYKKIQSDLMLELDERVAQFKKQLEEREREIEIKMLDISQNEKRKLENALRESTRKVEDLSEEKLDYEKIIDELKKENNKTTLQNNELRASLRESLGKGIEDKTKQNKIDINGIKINPNNKIKMIDTYNSREKELLENLGVEKSKSENFKLKLKKIKTYARKMRNLALDYFPVNEELPDILKKEVSVFLEDAENESVIQFLEFELKSLRERNKKYEYEISRMKEELKFGSGNRKTPKFNNNSSIQESSNQFSFNDKFNAVKYSQIDNLMNKNYENSNQKSSNGGKMDEEIQKKIFEELSKLKNDRPTTSSEEKKLRRELALMKEENQKLKAMINENAVISDETANENPRYLKQKIVFLENTVKQIEKERSEFSIRANMAEEQLNALQEHMSEISKQYQKKLLELSKRLESSDLRNNKYFN